ncbi:MAG: E3 binding domain-containing protein, partial [Actinomycetota bacterium]|nr:E3 binding domain-containing protein [Actinomycetota bacterium]
MAVDTSTIQIVMPAMGDSVAEGTILEWHKQEGDTVAVDETIVEVSTDKVDAEVPAPVSGTIIKILAAEGETVEVGAPLAAILPASDANGGSIGGVAGNTAGGAAAAAYPLPVSAESPPATPEEALAGAATEAEGAAAVAAVTGEVIDIVTPTGGESVTEGTILEWSVKVGDIVKDGDTVVEISTDKVDMELPAPASGTITEILAEDGETVTVGQVIARMTPTATASRSLASQATASRSLGGELGAPPTASRSVASRATASRSLGGELAGPAPPVPPPAGPEPTAPPAAADIAASPVARRVAAADCIDLSRVTGSARRGRITKADVLAAAAGNVESAGADSNGGSAGAE